MQPTVIERALRWLCQAIGQRSRLIPRPSLQGAIGVIRQHITPWVLLAYALVIAVSVYLDFFAGPLMGFLLGVVIGVYVLIYVPISFLLKLGWSRFFTRIVPAVLILTVGRLNGNSQFEYWVRADEFEQDVRAAQARDPNLEFVKWPSWNCCSDVYWKSYFYLVDDRQGFDPQGKACMDGNIEKLRPHFYIVECDLYKPLRKTK